MTLLNAASAYASPIFADADHERTPDIDICVEWITPEKALAYLATSPGNGTRNIQWAKVKSYASDMLKGRWYIGNDSMIFDVIERLRNSHHRLEGVVLAGKTNPDIRVPMLVRRNVPECEIPSMDRGRTRSIKDALSFEGHEVTKRDISVTRVLIDMLTGQQSITMSPLDIKDAIEEIRPQLDFVLRECLRDRRCPGTPSNVLPAFVAAAKCGYDRERIRLGIDMLCDGPACFGATSKYTPGQQSILALRDFLLTTVRHNGGGGLTRDIFTRACNMLQMFLNGTDRPKCTRNAEAVNAFRFKFNSVVPKEEFDATFTPESLHAISVAAEQSINLSLPSGIFAKKAQNAAKTPMSTSTLTKALVKAIAAHQGSVPLPNGRTLRVDNWVPGKRVMRIRVV